MQKKLRNGNGILEISKLPPNKILFTLTAKEEIIKFCSSKEFKTEIQPGAFGLKALVILFVMDEKKGSTEALEQKISQLEGVESVEVPDVRRAVG